MRKLILALTVPLLSLSVNANAHFALTMPPSTGGDAAGKGVPPCGPDGPAAVPTTATGGEMLKIHVNETVPHTGFYRIALSIDSRSELPIDPVVKDAGGNVLSPLGKPGGTSATAAYEDPAVFPVLADHLWVHDQSAGPKGYDTTIVLPNVTCAKCTLQVIEFMAGHGYNYTGTSDPGGGYLYHHCADLKITADPALPPFNAGGAGGAAGASSAGAGGASIAGSGGAATGGSGGASETGGTSAGGAPASAGAGPSAGGALAIAGSTSAAGASTTGTGGAEEPTSSDQSSGCSFGTRSSNATPELAALLGLLVLGVRRRRARAAR